MIANISVAILSTKIPILLGHGFWMFSLPTVIILVQTTETLNNQRCTA